MQFKQYTRTNIAEMAEWTPEVDMTDVSVSAEDKRAGSPKPGDMIARNPENHDDKWLVNADYFSANFAEVQHVVDVTVEEMVQFSGTIREIADFLKDHTYLGLPYDIEVLRVKKRWFRPSILDVRMAFRQKVKDDTPELR